MQIISELEPHNRGAYGGCIGFIGLNGNLNQAITIRSFVSRNGELWVFRRVRASWLKATMNMNCKRSTANWEL